MSVRNRFDRELENLHSDLERMCTGVVEAIDNAIEALEKKDEELAKQVIEKDKDIDNLERSIEARALRLLLSQQPVAKDLRAISTALKIITDLERIGDQAADIADLSLRFKNKKFIKELSDLIKMAETVSFMVKDCIKAYTNDDIALAEELLVRDDIVDDLFDKIKVELVTFVGKSDDITDQVLDLLMIAKYLERIGDHATGVAEWSIFNVTGTHKNKRIL